ncbi:hypothetical protein JOQ06_001546, partial [Pogonophryne albipinna]
RQVSPGAFMGSAYLDVHTLVEGAAGEVPAVWAEGHAVDGLLVAGQSVDTHPRSTSHSRTVESNDALQRGNKQRREG